VRAAIGVTTPKLTDEAVKTLWRKQPKEMIDEDYLQWIASDLRMFEANAADAVVDDAQHRQMGTDLGEGACARMMRLRSPRAHAWPDASDLFRKASVEHPMNLRRTAASA
jgi:hypothetical protein